MWLLNARTLKLEGFEGDQVPPYAILSHRWESEEITFQDVKRRKHRRKKGWRKVKWFCKMVEAVLEDQKVKYCWVDTCCIDKTNSAELSEAINSMYKWYQKSVMCFAYLSDVAGESSEEIDVSIRKSVWFTRCWTLQELIAPNEVSFFDNKWRFIGTRFTLYRIISEITGIRDTRLSGFPESGTLRAPGVPEYYSISERMSWATGRRSTRVEDEAYSLLGIFDVNMPLLYGEGNKAFSRLQDEILKVSRDQTMFAWRKPDPSPNVPDQALKYDVTPSPALYYNPGIILEQFDIVADSHTKYDRNVVAKEIQPTIVSGSGIAIDMYLVPHSYSKYFALIGVLPFRSGMSKKPWDTDEDLDINSRREEVSEVKTCSECSWLKVERHKCIIIWRDETDGQFMRCAANGKYIFDAPEHWMSYGDIRRIVLKRNILSQIFEISEPKASSYGIQVDTVRIDGVSHENISLLSSVTASNPRCLLLKVGTYGVVGMIILTTSCNPSKFLLFGLDYDFNPFCLMVIPKQYDQRPYCVQISVPELDVKSFNMSENGYVMELVKRLRISGRRFTDPSHDRVELHYGSWKDSSTVFRVNGVGQVQLNKLRGPQLFFGIHITPLDDKDTSISGYGYSSSIYGLPREVSLRHYWFPEWVPRSWAKIRDPYVLPQPPIEAPLDRKPPDDGIQEQQVGDKRPIDNDSSVSVNDTNPIQQNLNHNDEAKLNE